MMDRWIGVGFRREDREGGGDRVYYARTGGKISLWVETIMYWKRLKRIMYRCWNKTNVT